MTLALAGIVTLSVSQLLAPPRPAYMAQEARPGPSVQIALRLEHVAPQTADQQAAATAFAQGEAAYQRGEYAAAVAAFARAQRLVPHPSTLFNLGLAQAHAGRSLEAWETFSKLQAEAPSPQQRLEAEAELAKLRPTLSIVRVVAPAGAQVCVDGEPSTVAQEPLQRVTVPGVHRIAFDGTSTTIHLEPGETRDVDLGTGFASARARRRNAVLGSTLVVGGASAAVAVGLGIGAAVTRSRSAQLGLGVGAAVTASVAVASAIVGLVVTRQNPRRRSRPRPCGTPKKS